MSTAPTWPRVRPKLDAELEQVKTDLLTAHANDVARLQERARALSMVRQWFEEDPGEDRALSDDVNYTP